MLVALAIWQCASLALPLAALADESASSENCDGLFAGMRCSASEAIDSVEMPDLNAPSLDLPFVDVPDIDVSLPSIDVPSPGGLPAGWVPDGLPGSLPPMPQAPTREQIDQWWIAAIGLASGAGASGYQWIVTDGSQYLANAVNMAKDAKRRGIVRRYLPRAAKFTCSATLVIPQSRIVCASLNIISFLVFFSTDADYLMDTLSSLTED
ncbi:MAG: hypothetical protein ACKOWF_19285 [Chloroflexota bacterium]